MAHGNGSSPGAGGSRKPTLSRAARLIWRALRLRCPNCGRGHLLASWFRLREREKDVAPAAEAADLRVLVEGALRRLNDLPGLSEHPLLLDGLVRAAR